MRPKLKRVIWMAPLALLAMALFVFIGGQIIMNLWNWLLPPLFGWRLITFWQALGLLVLCRILFGGFHGHGGGPGWRMRRRMRERMEQRMAERWEHMTPEERERYRQGLGGFCGPARPSPGYDRTEGT